jgi:hypothetical protein
VALSIVLRASLSISTQQVVLVALAGELFQLLRRRGAIDPGDEDALRLAFGEQLHRRIDAGHAAGKRGVPSADRCGTLCSRSTLLANTMKPMISSTKANKHASKMSLTPPRKPLNRPGLSTASSLTAYSTTARRRKNRHKSGARETCFT